MLLAQASEKWPLLGNNISFQPKDKMGAIIALFSRDLGAAIFDPVQHVYNLYIYKWSLQSKDVLVTKLDRRK